jgi:hypothetical protein
MWLCKHCNESFDIFSTSQKGNHSRWCKKNPEISNYRNGLNKANTIEIMNKARKAKGYDNQYTKAKTLGLEVPINPRKGQTCEGRPHTDETRKKLSEIQKTYLKNNPEKHPWVYHKSYISIPCENFKKILTENNINYVPEYAPLFPERHFSIDIAFPDIKVGIEINGNQHYNSDKTLAPYYVERKRLLEESGWRCYDIHYSLVYNKHFVENFIKEIKTTFNLENIDYSFFPKRTSTICECGNKKCRTKAICKECALLFPKPRKFNISKEELQQLVLKQPMTQIGRLFNVSDNAIRKRCKLLDITIPIRQRNTLDKLEFMDNIDGAGI